MSILYRSSAALMRSEGSLSINAHSRHLCHSRPRRAAHYAPLESNLLRSSVEEQPQPKERDMQEVKRDLPIEPASIVSPQEWEAARQKLLVKEKELTHARDALAAERRRMPWVAVEKRYEFEGPNGKASLFDLFEGRRQLIVYRAFYEPGVHGWPEHA